MRIFIGHIIEDKALAEEKLKIPLQSAGYDVWLCQSDNRSQIKQDMTVCDVIIEVISPAFFDSDMDSWLPETARELSKPLISVVLLETDYIAATRNLNTIKLVETDDASFEQLIETIKIVAEDETDNVDAGESDTSLEDVVRAKPSGTDASRDRDNARVRQPLKDWQQALVNIVLLIAGIVVIFGAYTLNRQFKVQRYYDSIESSNDIDEQIQYYGQIIAINDDDIIAHFERANLYVLSGQYENAILDYTDVIDIDPDSEGIHLARANAYLQTDNRNNYQNALQDFSVVIEQNPESLEAYLGRGIAYHYLDEYDNAIEEFTYVIAHYPATSDAYALRGWSYSFINQNDSAFEDYALALELEPDNADAYFYQADTYFRMEDYKTAIEWYTQAIDRDSQLAEAYRNRGIAYAELRSYESAIDDLTESLELSPDDWLALSRRGRAYYEIEAYRLARNDLRDSIRMNPDNLEAYLYRGLAYYELEDYGAAIDDLTTATEFESSSRVYTYRGLSYLQQSNYSAALTDFNRAIERDSANRQAYIGRAEAHYELDNLEDAVDDYTEALEIEADAETHMARARLRHEMGSGFVNVDISAAVRLDPRNAEMLEEIAEIYSDLDYPMLSIEYFSLAIGIEPTIYRHNNRGWLRNEVGLHEGAIEDFTAVLEMDSDHLNALINRGYAYGEIEEFELALADHERALEVEPNVYSYNNRAWIYRVQGEYDLALESYQSGIELDPTYPNFYWGLGNLYDDLEDFEQAMENYCQYIELTDEPASYVLSYIEDEGGCD